VAPDLDTSGYWYTVLVIYALLLLGLLFTMFTVCCKDFDPLSDFERRRKKQTKEQLEAERKAKKLAKKEAKKAGKGKKGVAEDVMGSDLERAS